MNIQQATEQIRGALRAYLSQDEHGLYRIPFYMQRPLLLLGPPGVGKTAIVAQVARELDINFVSYSITHHTRQSALGLPFIVKEEFGDASYRVSEYTMSEIIGAVHRAVAASGVAQGILFLDEVNCVSETLAPAMLQFLQYKTFGMHQLPEGWVIVAAGNPPAYNRAAREFDPVTMDRLKRIDIEPDVRIWQNYAAAHEVHPAVTSFLEAKPGSFYKLRAGIKGTTIVTARGWEDLSRILQAYEAEGLVVNEDLVRQYLQDDETAREFAAYYELFCKYQDNYRIDDIIAGKYDDDLIERARDARFDERIALVGLVLDTVLHGVHTTLAQKSALALVRRDLVDIRPQLEGGGAQQALADRASMVRGAHETGNAANRFAGDRQLVKACRLHMLDAIASALSKDAGTLEKDSHASGKNDQGSFEQAKACYNKSVHELAGEIDERLRVIDNAFSFVDAAFGEESQESLILTTKLSADTQFIAFVSEHASDAYMRHNKSLLFEERKLDLLHEIEESRSASSASSVA